MNGLATRRAPGRTRLEEGRTRVATVHLVIGSLIILVYIVVLVGYFRGMQGGPAAWVRQLSMAGALLLLVQYALGFTLLGDSDTKPNALHYVFALATILTVGAEHMVGGQETDPVRRSRIGMLTVLGTLVLTLLAYGIGESTST